ncbi:MAG: glycerol-3-phosphate acyltransferase [Chloroflexi bacterium]|nr:glycerol-3-phosphate acyltransferase [Chloroflexota bacterium]
MQMLINAGLVALAYILGSIPFGLLVVRVSTGKDIRDVASGRTGGTNAMRAAGLGAGLATALLDILKGAVTVWAAQILTGNDWVRMLTPIAAILGHNYSIFLAERDETGKLRLRGGAGGAPTVGGAVGLWWPSFFIIIPVGALIFFGVGYASVTTISVALIATAIFTVRYFMGTSPWQDILYGVIAFLLLVYALRPNIKALMEGRERFHGWRPWKKKETEEIKDE